MPATKDRDLAHTAILLWKSCQQAVEELSTEAFSSNDGDGRPMRTTTGCGFHSPNLATIDLLQSRHQAHLVPPYTP